MTQFWTNTVILIVLLTAVLWCNNYQKEEDLNQIQPQGAVNMVMVYKRLALHLANQYGDVIYFIYFYHYNKVVQVVLLISNLLPYVLNAWYL